MRGERETCEGRGRLERGEGDLRGERRLARGEGDLRGGDLRGERET